MAAAGDSHLFPIGAMDSDISQASHFYPAKGIPKKIRSDRTIERIFSPIISLFNCKNADRLKTAAIWLLRAYNSVKPLDRLLESAIALEVLLGEREMSDKIGLSKLMANRCAYAISNSEIERKEIIEFFLKFYRLRSDIVHTGRFSIKNDEREIVDEGIRLAARMLVYEQGQGS